jgi:hypothetical protein
MHQTITEHFHFWLKATYHGNVPDKDSPQYKQLRFAFFAGFSVMLSTTLRLGNGTVEEATTTIKRYQTEVLGYLDSMIEQTLKG